MIRKQTWIVLIVLAVVIGVYIYLDKNDIKIGKQDATPTPATEISYLFSAQEGNASSIEIASQTGEVVQVKRGDNGWMIEKPVVAEADQGLVEAAATQVSALRILNNVEIDPQLVGLNTPAYKVTVSFTGGKEHSFSVGDQTPTGSGYYVQTEDGKTVIVSLNGIDALLKLLQSPPYLATPTLTPEPSATPLPPTATLTPTPNP
jgi:hypothetical protein